MDAEHGASPGGPARAARPALVAGAAVALAVALGLSPGFLDPAALALATAATIMAVAALALGRAGGTVAATTGRWAAGALAIGVALGLAFDLVTPPGFYVPRDTVATIRPLVAGIAVATLTHLWTAAPPLVARARFPVILLLAAAAGAIVIARSPRPHIDVWYFQQIGAGALLEGVDPYLVAYPNIYGPNSGNYAPAVLTPDQRYVLGNPYPPLTILLGALPVALGGDVRWVSLALILFSAWAIRRLGRGALAAELAAVLLLVQPRALFVLEQSWTEPTVLAAVLGTALLVQRWRGAAAVGTVPRWAWPTAGVAAGLALASKQYAVLLLLPVLFATPERARWKAAAVAVATAAAIVVPFVAWDPGAFVRAVLEFQVAQPFRPDALSWIAAAVQLGGPLLPVWPAFLLAAAVLALGIRRKVPLDQAVLAGAAAWLALVLFNKQAFCNYYWLAVGMLCGAAALSVGDGSASARSGPASR